MPATSVLTLNEFEFQARFGNVYRSVFCGVEASRESFVNQSWNFVLLPFELNFPDEDFQALSNAAKQCGDEDFVATDVETTPPHQASCIIPWDNRSAMLSARQEALLGAVVTAIF